jgi:hypothetical protein
MTGDCHVRFCEKGSTLTLLLLLEYGVHDKEKFVQRISFFCILYLVLFSC